MTLRPLAPLHDTAAHGPDVLTAGLRDWYGGALAFAEPGDRPYVVGNFVQTVDGIVSFRAPGPEPMFGEPHDRMLMSILRAWSDAVVVGRATFMADPRASTWHWKTTAPAGHHELLREMERTLDRPRPHFEVIVSARGAGIDFARKLFHDADVRAVIATTRKGAEQARVDLARVAGATAEIWELDSPRGEVDVGALTQKLFASGRKHVLVEGGAALYGAFESTGLIDEIFLAHRAMVGGTDAAHPRPTFSGAPHEPARAPALDLVSVRAALETSTLFTRWRYRAPSGP